MNYGLAAHRLHRVGNDSALVSWAKSCAVTVQELDLLLHSTEGSYTALTTRGLLTGHLQSVGSGRTGGLMRLVSKVAGGVGPESALDGIFFFVDPIDPTSLYPEAQALKRQCVIHGKPFIATLAGAMEWLAIEAMISKKNRALPMEMLQSFDLGSQSVALIAHDAQKKEMIAFAAEHFGTLSRYKSRVATGTTGGLLNDMAWSKHWPRDTPWVNSFQSGPLGGDAQIAELVLDGQCEKVIFFEDPHVARQHEADIQLLERAVYSAGNRTTCFNSPVMARRWALAASSNYWP
jgi:methylglyoxal synthase